MSCNIINTQAGIDVDSSEKEKLRNREVELLIALNYKTKKQNFFKQTKK